MPAAKGSARTPLGPKTMVQGGAYIENTPEAFRSVNILTGPGRVPDSLIVKQQNSFRALHGTVTASIKMQKHVNDQLEARNVVSVRGSIHSLTPHLLRKLQ